MSVAQQLPVVLTDVLTPNPAGFPTEANAMVTVALNHEYVAVATSADSVSLYSRDEATQLFENPDILKLVSRPREKLQYYLPGVECRNCRHIGTHIRMVASTELLLRMKDEIRALPVSFGARRLLLLAALMMRYISLSKSYNAVYVFNKKRDAYLYYLTVFNDILAAERMIPSDLLLKRAESYPNYCRLPLSASTALDGLIKTGTLRRDRFDVISLPD